MCSHCVRASRFLVWALGDRPGNDVRRLRGDRTEIMLCWCSCRAVSADSARKSYGARASLVQRPRGDGAVTVGGPYDCPKSV